MSWNYRVIRHEEPDGSTALAIHEVYYDLDGETPIKYGENPAVIIGEGAGKIDGLKWQLDMMRDALESPILDEKDFECSSE